MSFYEDMVNDIVAEFESNIKDLIEQKNTISIIHIDPPLKKVISYPVHRNIFAKVFGRKFGKAEEIKCAQDSLEKRYKLSLLERVKMLFPQTNLLTFNKFGDFCLLAPMMAVQKDHRALKKGQLVIPIKETENDSSFLFLVIVMKKTNPLSRSMI